MVPEPPDDLARLLAEVQRTIADNQRFLTALADDTGDPDDAADPDDETPAAEYEEL